MAEWLPWARRVPSDNCDQRPGAAAIDLVVVHAISLPPGRYGGGLVDALFTNCLDCQADPALADLEGVTVSAHVLIERSGAVTQYVPFDLRAWHAGVSSWQGRAGCNDFSVGIELEGCDTDPFTDAQYRALRRVLDYLYDRHGLGPGQVTGHQHIAPGRKTDPGPCFDWARIQVEPLSSSGLQA